ncbi:hypothetical protein CLAIMM_09444 [Cladophialophora immunda]|nr:hypothetical protein CLAIMM_09444 [Cladophialophora immunda]
MAAASSMSGRSDLKSPAGVQFVKTQLGNARKTASIPIVNCIPTSIDECQGTPLAPEPRLVVQYPELSEVGGLGTRLRDAVVVRMAAPSLCLCRQDTSMTRDLHASSSRPE